MEESLRAAIRSGRLGAGTRLPSTRALSEDLGLARGTVVEAFDQLQTEGYLEARHGSGTWVAAVAVSSPTPTTAAAATAAPPRYDFHPGLPDLTAFPRAAWTAALRRALRAAPASSLGYGDPRGRAELRSELAAYLARARGVVADPELIVVCAGFRHGLALLARVLSARGAAAMAMEDPCVTAHREVAASAGLRVEPLAVDWQGARTDLLPTFKVAAVVLAPAHQFPLGVTLRPERRAAAVGWARATGGLVIEDDYDGEFRYDRQPVGALQALDPAHVAYGGTASKTLAPGLRLAWLQLPPNLTGEVVALRRAEDVHVPAPDQLAFTELLRTGVYERHIRRMRARYRSRRDRLIAVLAEHAPDITAAGISAGLRVLLRLPPGGPSAQELAARARDLSIGLVPLAEFHHDPTTDDTGMVVGYGALPEHDFEGALQALRRFLDVHRPALR